MGWGVTRKAKETARLMLERIYRVWQDGQRSRRPRHPERFCLSQHVSLHKPRTPTEFEIQATLWLGLKKLGYEVHGQLRLQFSGIRQKMIVDLAVYRDNALVALIETKKSRAWQIRFTSAEADVQNQVCKYAMKCRTYLICGISEAEAFLKVVEAVGHMPDVTELGFHRCTVDHVTVMSDYQFAWNGLEIFPRPQSLKPEVSRDGA